MALRDGWGWGRLIPGLKHAVNEVLGRWSCRMDVHRCLRLTMPFFNLVGIYKMISRPLEQTPSIGYWFRISGKEPYKIKNKWLTDRSLVCVAHPDPR